jgi:hypothetical protein
MATKKTTKKTKKKKSKSFGAGTIDGYINQLEAEGAEIAFCLKREIKALLPNAISKIYHGIPVWFLGENAVVGFGVTAKKNIKLLFWNGQAFKEPALTAVGSFSAAKIEFKKASEIRMPDLRRWLKKSGKDVWDLTGMLSGSQGAGQPLL